MATKRKAHPQKGGRKSKWATHVEPRLETIKYWRRMGVWERDIAKELKVGLSAFYDYKRKYPQLAEVLKESKQDFTAKIIDSIAKRAFGFERDKITTTVIHDDKGKQVGRIQVQKTREYFPPHPTLQIFLAKNLEPERWRDVQGREHSGPDGRTLHTQAPVIHAYIPDNHRPRKEPNGNNGHRRKAVTTAIRETARKR